MALEVCIWLLIVMFGVLSLACFVSSVACFCSGEVAVGCLAGWFGLVPSATTAFLCWLKGEL